MSENRVPSKLKNNVTFLSVIFWSELNWATYGVFVETGTARTMLGSIVNKQNLSWQGRGCSVLWCTYSAWNSNRLIIPAYVCHLRYFCWDWQCTHYAWTHCAVHISCSAASVHLYRRTGPSMTSANAAFSLVNPHRPITSLQIWTTYRQNFTNYSR